MSIAKSATQFANGDHDAWQAHLHAALNMYRRARSVDYAPFGLSSEAKKIVSGDIYLVDYNIAVVEEVDIFRFWSCVVYWLDLVSCITEGRAPDLVLQSQPLLSKTSHIQIGNVFGCENWVVVEIARVAQLYQDKVLAVARGRFDAEDAERKAESIQTLILSRLENNTGHTEVVGSTSVIGG